jgi:hypothetical protein
VQVEVEVPMSGRHWQSSVSQSASQPAAIIQQQLCGLERLAGDGDSRWQYQQANRAAHTTHATRSEERAAVHWGPRARGPRSYCQHRGRVVRGLCACGEARKKGLRRHRRSPREGVGGRPPAPPWRVLAKATCVNSLKWLFQAHRTPSARCMAEHNV